MMASAVHLMANAVHPSETFDVHDGIFSTPVGIYSTPYVRLLVYMIGYADHLMSDAVHPSVAPDVRRWPLQYTQVRLLKYTPVLFLMLDDALCSTLDGKCSTPK